MINKSFRNTILITLLFTIGLITNNSIIDNLPADIEIADQVNADSSSIVNDEQTNLIIPSGEPIGIYVKASGVMVVDVCEITDKYENKISPCRGFIYKGDYIDSINGKKVNCKSDLVNAIKCDYGDGIDITVRRNQNIFDTHVNAVTAKNGNKMLGLMVKDDISGIGTWTYISKNGFGALGHSINDIDTGRIVDIAEGAIYGVELINIVKANKNMPGRLEGMIDYSKSNIVGRIDENQLFGISGKITKNGAKKLSEADWMPVAKKNEIKIGKASIKSSISGVSKLYDINITKINYDTYDGLKGIEIKVTDSELLGYTNGIVQGMSGSPIIQNGKVVGAITHVLVNDPTRGYGIFIENMLEH